MTTSASGPEREPEAGETPFEPSPPPLVPLTPRRSFKPSGLRGWIYLAAFAILAVGIVSYLVSEAGDGSIVFGTSVNTETREIGGVTSTFHPGDAIAYRASLRESVPGSELVIRSTHTRPDGTVETANESTPAGSSSVNRIISKAAVPLSASDVGRWRLEVLHNEKVLAVGEFTVAAAGS
jgi:hypothetical protein